MGNDLDARERVRLIAETVSRPRSVNWIREEADVSWQTAKSKLDRLVEHHQLQRVTLDDEDDAHRYVPDYRTQYLDRIRELVENNSAPMLRAEIATIQEEIDGWFAEFDVDGRANLEETLEESDLDAEEIRRRNRVIRQWERNEQRKKLLSHALQLYDDLHSLDATVSAGSIA